MVGPFVCLWVPLLVSLPYLATHGFLGPIGLVFGVGHGGGSFFGEGAHPETTVLLVQLGTCLYGTLDPQQWFASKKGSLDKGTTRA